MSEVDTAKRRLKTMLWVSCVCGAIAVAAVLGALELGQAWLYGVFGLAMAAGFGTQIWFVAGFGRTKKGV